MKIDTQQFMDNLVKHVKDRKQTLSQMEMSFEQRARFNEHSIHVLMLVQFVRETLDDEAANLFYNRVRAE